MRLRSKLLVAGILVMTLVVAPVTTFLVVGSFDAPPFDDTDLRPERAEEVPDDQNGFPLLREAYAAMFRLEGGKNLDGTTPEYPEDTGDDSAEKVLSDGKRLDYMVSGEKWDDAVAEDYLRRNRKALDLLDQALARPRWQLPYFDSVDAELPYANEFLRLGELMQLESRAQARRGEAAEAYGMAMKIMDFGNRLEHANNCLVTYLVGLTVRGMGTELFSDYAATCPLPPEDLRAYAQRLGDMPPRGEDLAHALRVDYLVAANAVDQIRAHGMEKYGPGYGGPEWAFASSPYRLHPNRTKQLFADAYRVCCAAAAKPYWEAKADIEDLAHQIEAMSDRARADWWSLLRPNAVGEYFYFRWLPASNNVIKTKAITEIQLSATCLLLALRACKDEHGRPAETLQALVPAYLDAVPSDPFDGKPMRYDVQKRILYSVGKDGVDTGGLAREEQERWWKEEEPGSAEEEPPPPPERMPDPSYLIEF